MLHVHDGTTLALWRRLHRDERGAITIETVIILGAIALPVLIFLLKFGWPRIRDGFSDGVERLEIEADRVKYGR
jgi:hypothetical protein